MIYEENDVERELGPVPEQIRHELAAFCSSQKKRRPLEIGIIRDRKVFFWRARWDKDRKDWIVRRA